MRHLITQTTCHFVHRGMCGSSQSAKTTGRVLAIRKEKSSIWERRAPLSADHVKQLCQKGIKVIVQPCNRRIFANEAYKDAGAEIREDISEASVIMGVKKVPTEDLLPDKTYCFFSHVIDEYEENKQLLDCILSKNIRLIGFENLVDSEGRKSPKDAFSRYAGMAGCITILHGLGLRLLSLGHTTPYLHIGLPHTYKGTYQALRAVREAGYEIALGQMPKSIKPLVFAFLGTGNVSEGAQEVFEQLPFEYIGVKDLPQVHDRGSTSKVYGVVIGTEDYLRKKGGGDFNREEFREHPDRYVSVFADEVAPFASVVVNGLRWQDGYPKLLKNSDAKSLLASSFKDYGSGSPLPHRLLAICDVSADSKGPFEFIQEYTSIDCPFIIYDAAHQKQEVASSGPGVLVCSIHNMPAQLALEATESFGGLLLPYIDSILDSDAAKPLEEHTFHPSIRGAIITSSGKLLPEFEYIHDKIKEVRK